MFSVFDDLRRQVRFKGEEIFVSSAVFSAMKVAMLATLLVCSVVTAKTYIGDNINCDTGFYSTAPKYKPSAEHRAIQTYCFITSTFSLVNVTESETPHPGVGSLSVNGDAEEDESLKRHAYYQWVPMVLAIQVAAFYFPSWLWQNIVDRKKFCNVMNHLHVLHIDDDLYLNAANKNRASNLQEQRELTLLEKRLHASAQYMADTWRDHGDYATRFLLCEVIAFAIALGNLFFTNTFLGGAFFSYGHSALSYITSDIHDLNNPLNEVFPKVAKCTFRKFGPTGSIQSFDVLCVLPLNIVNEKGYILLWIVYIITFCVVSVTTVCHVVVAVLGSSLQHKIIKHRIKSEEAKFRYEQLQRHLNYGSLFYVYHLSSHMVGMYFEEWIAIVCDAVTAKKK